MQIIQLPTGSTTGITAYSKVTRCARMAAFDAERGSVPNFKMMVGTLFHAHLEQYHQHGYAYDPDGVVFMPSVTIKGAEQRALDAFKRYRLSYGPNRFGKVLACERSLSGPAVEAAVGISPYAARLDMTVELSEEDCRHFEQPVWPGVWVCDHKTSWWPDNDYSDSLQLVAYQMALATEVKVEGCIVNRVFLTDREIHKDGTSSLQILNFPTLHEQEKLRSFFRGIAAILNHPILSTWPNPTACKWPTPCAWEGDCSKVAP